jgi:PAS domain S-box-containing protein
MGQGIEILIVEDSPTQAEQLQHILELHDYQVTHAADGKQALALLRECTPTMVISDIMMPEMNGYQLCQQIKSDERLKNIPVVLLTSLSDPVDIVRGMECGADNFLTKPYDEQMLLSRIQYILLNRELRRSGRTQMGMEIIISGKKFTVTTERQQILDLLITTYETAVQKNLELLEAQEELRALNESLEERVEERTAALVAEIAERRRTEEALRKSEEQVRLLVEGVSDYAIFMLNPEGRIVSWNAGAGRIKGYSEEEIIGQHISICFTPEDVAQGVPEKALRTAATEGRYEYECWLVRKDGSRFLGNKIITALRDQTGGLRGFADVTRDITERSRVEEALRHSEERYRLLFARNPQPMWVFDLETLAFLEVNEAAIHHYGYSREEFLAMTIKDIRPPEEIPTLLANISARAPQYEEAGVWKHKRKDGTIIEVEITSHELTFNGRPAQIVLAYDVTERRTLEAQFRQSQKLESVGQLAGGIAHDFNNLLTVISGYSDLLLRGAKDESQRQKIDEVKKAAERAASLTRQLLAFSRKQVLEPKVIDLNDVVAEADNLLRRLIGEDIHLTVMSDPGLWRVKADPGQLSQVIINLAVNARDAMPRGGKLTIETRNVELDEAYARQHGAVRPGPYVMLAVSDTGVGMDAETQRQIFEPFFTTKEVGKGTGLGLSMVYGVVKQSGGNIWVYSEPGRGTTFKIYLPRVDDRGEKVQAAAPPALPPGTETILLVEDEGMVRMLLRDILVAEGYTVLAASGGPEALQICGRHEGSIHLIVTDVVMPGMSGRELVARLSETCRDLKVLYISGYTDDAIVHHGVLDEGTNFLQKPFTPDAVLRKVREVLDSGM